MLPLLLGGNGFEGDLSSQRVVSFGVRFFLAGKVMGIACLITNTDLFRMLTSDVGMFCGHISRDDGMTSYWIQTFWGTVENESIF